MDDKNDGLNVIRGIFNGCGMELACVIIALVIYKLFF